MNKLINNDNLKQSLKSIFIHLLNEIKKINTANFLNKQESGGTQTGVVKKADNLLPPENVILNSSYGIDINGNIGYFPNIKLTNVITPIKYSILQNNVETNISINTDNLGLMIQVWEKESDANNQALIVHKYNNTLIVNHTENIISKNDVLQIKDEYLGGLNYNDGIYESDEISDFVCIDSLYEVD